MRKNPFLLMPALMLVAIVMMFIAATGSTSAQQNLDCCYYRVNIEGVTADCFPFTLYADWSCEGGPYTTTSQTYATNGTYTHSVVTPPGKPCPKACKLDRITLDGITYIYQGQEQQVYINNCCYRIYFSFDQDKCIFIRIKRC